MAHGIVIDGKAIASEVKAKLKSRVEALVQEGRSIRLDAILVGGDQGARLYAKNQAKACEAIGLVYHLHELPTDATESEVLSLIESINKDDAITGLMVHMPLPKQVNAETIQSAIAVTKDVEGVNPANIGNVVFGRRSLVPCTALAVMELIESTGVKLEGANVVCVGASRIVGKPVAVLLMQAEATVISTNHHTKDRPSLTRAADIVVSAAGVPNLIGADDVSEGAVVIDVGINRIENGDGKKITVGDVDFDAVKEKASYISPVPGGVGPMTVAMLLRNTVQAADS
ncbi:MAG: bifunctional 5,10-methylene-tetrahydrofolate dehydrogenase/5,10-methylene-tetrahydrofolate cyclohydrolase [Phycisphaerae bacterium]|nr:bifunctional 5,10-methylene-tetrahydrofolate dehydrogenase/5,10-methylene-tetrahydrofolate cyclohydrolase [Phycisphaerae bacterium]